MGWTLIHAFATNIGNPDTPLEDDGIYGDSLDWNGNWQMTLLNFLGAFVFGTFLYLVLWCLANGIWHDRRIYVDSCGPPDKEDHTDVSETDSGHGYLTETIEV